MRKIVLYQCAAISFIFFSVFIVVVFADFTIVFARFCLCVYVFLLRVSQRGEKIDRHIDIIRYGIQVYV